MSRRSKWAISLLAISLFFLFNNCARDLEPASKTQVSTQSPSPVPTPSPSPSPSPSPTPTPSPTPAPSPAPTWTLYSVGQHYYPEEEGGYGEYTTADIYRAWVHDSVSRLATFPDSKKVDCAMDIGVLWPNEPDFASFPASVKGNAASAFGDRYLNANMVSTLGPLMQARMQVGKTNGCDSILLRTRDIHLLGAGTVGFQLTQQQFVNYISDIVGRAHGLGLGIGIESSPTLANNLNSIVDFAYTEHCIYNGNCSAFNVYRTSGKPVFGYEQNGATCTQALAFDFDFAIWIYPTINYCR